MDGVVVAAPLKLFRRKSDSLPGAHVQESLEHVARVVVVDPGAEVVVGLPDQLAGRHQVAGLCVQRLAQC